MESFTIGWHLSSYYGRNADHSNLDDYCHHIIFGWLTSGPTPQVASPAAHMYVCGSKLRDVVWVRVFGIDSSNSFPGHAIFDRLEDSSWFTWKMHQFTLAKHTLAARSIQNHTHVPRLWLKALYALLRTRRRHPSMARRLCRVSTPWERQATFLSDDSSNKRLVQLHDRLPRGSQAAWRRSRSTNVVHDRGWTQTHIHTCTYLIGTWPMATFPPLLWEKTGELSDDYCFKL